MHTVSLSASPRKTQASQQPPPSTSGQTRDQRHTRIGKPHVFVFQRREHVEGLELNVAFLCASGGLPTRQNDGRSSAGSTRQTRGSQVFFFLNKDMDAQLKDLLVTLTSEPALRIIRQQPRGAQAFRDLVSKVQSSFASSKSSCISIWSRASWCHRDSVIVFERLFGEKVGSRREGIAGCTSPMRRSEERSAGTRGASVAHLWFTSLVCHHETDRGKLLMAAKPAKVNGRSTHAIRHRGDTGRGANTSREKGQGRTETHAARLSLQEHRR